MTQWRYLQYNPNSNSPSSMPGTRRSTACSVKRNCDDRWQLLGSNDKQTRAILSSRFLKHCPNLINTPPLVITCPDGLDEVSKRFESEEGRVNDIEKMIILHELRDFVFQKRVNEFHWDVNNCVELEFSRQHYAGNLNDSPGRVPTSRTDTDDGQSLQSSEATIRDVTVPDDAN